MQNTTPQPLSLKSLLIASLLACILALVILVIIVIPAEFGIDITGVGKKLGLTVLATATESTVPGHVIECPVQGKQWSDRVQITLPADSGLEYKFFLEKDAILEYEWTANGSSLYFDFHGEPQGDNSGYFKSYQESTDKKAAGSLQAPFSGSHGWYWENRTREDVVIMLQSRGDYRVIGLIH